MNLKQIEAFVQVARIGSVSAAAARLNATQPAISMRLRELERSIEADLLDRSLRTIRLTPVGRAFLDYAERIHALTEEALAEFGTARAVTGHIRLGVTETVALTWLPDLVGRINARFPEVVVELGVDLTEGVWNRLNHGDLEVALLPGPVGGPNLECRSLGFIRYDWMARPSLNIPDRKLTPVDLDRKSVV
jgi:DNA-binding transcriptional LysR family regulator